MVLHMCLIITLDASLKNEIYFDNHSHCKIHISYFSANDCIGNQDTSENNSSNTVETETKEFDPDLLETIEESR